MSNFDPKPVYVPSVVAPVPLLSSVPELKYTRFYKHATVDNRDMDNAVQLSFPFDLLKAISGNPRIPLVPKGPPSPTPSSASPKEGLQCAGCEELKQELKDLRLALLDEQEARLKAELSSIRTKKANLGES